MVGIAGVPSEGALNLDGLKRELQDAGRNIAAASLAFTTKVVRFPDR